MTIDESKILVFDADVLIHFIQGEAFSELRFIYPKNKKVVLKHVYDELQISSESRVMLDSAIETFKFLSITEFPLSTEMMKEYAHLTSPLMDLGKGESACLSYCKFTKDAVVSNNLKDVRNYCKTHKIDYLTTLDLVKWAFDNQVWNKNKCDEFIQTVIKKGGKIPNVKIEDFVTVAR
jgi:predicted nucleic acid-binding protein